MAKLYNSYDFNELQSSIEQLHRTMEMFNTDLKRDFEGIFQASKKASSGTGENFDLDARKAIAQLRNEYSTNTQKEKENEKAKENYIEQLQRLEQTKTIKNIKDPKEKKWVEDRIKLLKAEINLQTEREKHEKEKHRYDEKLYKEQTKYLQLQTKNAEKETNIKATSQAAKTIQEKWDKRGYNKKSGRRNSFAEISSAIGKGLANIRKDSIGRNVGKGFAALGKVGSSALNIIDSGKMDVSGMASKVSGTLSQMGPYGAAAGAAVDIFAKLFEMYSKVDTAASKYSRSVGGGRATMIKMRNEAAKLADQFSELGNRSYDAADIIDTMAEYSTTLGRNLEYVSDSSIKAMKDLKDYGIGMDIISQFDTFGLSVETVSKKMNEVYQNAGKRGLNVKAVTDTMTKNLKMAQNYTFSRGLKALESMAQKSVSLKYNMEMAARFADKVSTIEGATGAAAQLSVLGGDFARFGNPLQMLYGGLQDVEQLNEMMNKMTQNLAYFDKEKGQVDISAFDRQRLKAVAESTGTDYGELINMAMTQGRRRVIDEKLSGGAGANIKDEDTREFIRNIAELDEKGNAFVKIKDEYGNTHERRLEDLSDKDKETLKKESEARAKTNSENVGDILTNTRSIQEKLDDIIKTIKTWIVNLLMDIAGVTDTEKGEMGGLNRTNANYFEALSDTLHSNYKNMDEKTITALKNIGIDDNEIKKIQSGSLSEDARDQLLIDKILAKQESGFTLTGTKSSHTDAQDVEYGTWVEPQKHADGGLILGKGTSTSDSIPARLSNGEYVVNAKNTQNNLGLLNDINTGKISNGSNPYKFTEVNSNNKTETSNLSNGGKMSFEPLNINLGGKIELTSNGSSKYLTAEEILTPVIINKIIKEIQIQTDYAFDKNKVHWKYGS